MEEKLFPFLNRTVNKALEETYANMNTSITAGYANGYVAIPPNHPLGAVHYDNLNEKIDIHGGLTFSESVEKVKAYGWGADIECIGFDSFDEIPGNYWIYGFDTMHYGDGAHLDREWCINETKHLMAQLENIKRL